MGLDAVDPLRPLVTDIRQAVVFNPNAAIAGFMDCVL